MTQQTIRGFLGALKVIQNYVHKSFDVDTQTSDVEDTVSEGKEVSGDSSESYIVDSSQSYIGEKEDNDDDPFFICFGEMSDKAFHNMMSVNDLTYSIL